MLPLFAPVVASLLIAAPAPTTQLAAQAPLRADATVTAWSFQGVRPPAQRPRISIEGANPVAEERIADKPLRPKDSWGDVDGFRFTGTKVAYTRHF